jgi:hypothetical protein
VTHEKLILKIGKFTEDLDTVNKVSAALIAVAVWNAVRSLGQEEALRWISDQVNESMASAVKVRKKRGLAI